MSSVKDPFSTIKNVARIREYIHTVVGHDNWFISGSFANPIVLDPNDIDVFFHTEADYESAVVNLANLNSIDEDMSICDVTTNAATFFLHKVPLPLQFIRKSFGTVEEIFNGFDLNVCKKALLPDGTSVSHESSDEKLCIDHVSYDTFTRYFKYANKLYTPEEVTVLGKKLIDTFIDDNTIIENYYLHSKVQYMTNDVMFKQAICNDSLQAYAYEQAKIHAPELLL